MSFTLFGFVVFFNTELTNENVKVWTRHCCLLFSFPSSHNIVPFIVLVASFSKASTSEFRRVAKRTLYFYFCSFPVGQGKLNRKYEDKGSVFGDLKKLQQIEYLRYFWIVDSGTKGNCTKWKKHLSFISLESCLIQLVISSRGGNTKFG